MKNGWQVIFVLVIFSALVVFAVGGSAFGQVAKSSPPPAPSVAAPLPEVPLTDAEAKDLQINELKRQNLILQMQQIENEIEQKFHFNEQRTKVFEENQRLTMEFAKAHHVDSSKYKLDPEKKALVLIAAPAAGKK